MGTPAKFPEAKETRTGLSILDIGLFHLIFWFANHMQSRTHPPPQTEEALPEPLGLPRRLLCVSSMWVLSPVENIQLNKSLFHRSFAPSGMAPASGLLVLMEPYKYISKESLHTCTNKRFHCDVKSFIFLLVANKHTSKAQQARELDLPDVEGQKKSV